MPIFPAPDPKAGKPRGADAEAARQQQVTDANEAPELDPATGKPRDAVSIHDFAYQTGFEFDEDESLPDTGRFP